MKSWARCFWLAMAAFSAGCSTTAHIAPPAKTESPAVSRPQGKFTEAELNAQYYYDLGSDTIDVSSYPQNQQKNYALFARVCSQCHTLSRPINSPRESYIAWKFYVLTMRMRSKFTQGTSYTPEEAQDIVDFLTYDSMIRKDVHREEFEAVTKKLENRFDQVLVEQMSRLFQGMPKPHSLNGHR